MLRTVTTAIISAFMLLSCGTKTVRVVEKTWPGGKEQLVVYYSDDEKHEKVREEQFYPDGKLKMEGGYENDQREGMWRSWYSNGNLWSEGEFSNGKGNGIRKVYYENGQLRYRGFYTDDKKSGEWEFYDENGKLIRKENY